MKIKAKQWVNYQGVWYKAGDEFRIFKGDADEMKKYGEVIKEAEDKAEEKPEEVQEEPVQEEPVQETTARRGRRRKIEEA